MKKTRVLALVLSLLMIASIASAETAADPVVIKVGEVVIPLSTAQGFFDTQYTMYRDDYAANGQVLTEDDIKIILNESIELQVFTTLMDIKIKENNLTNITDEQKAQIRTNTEADFADNVNAFAEYFGISIEEANKTVAEYGITVDTLYEDALNQFPYQSLFDMATEGVTVSEEEVAKAYDSYVAADKAMLEDNAGTYEYMSAGYMSEYDSYTGYTGPSRTLPFYIPEGFRRVKHILLEYPDAIVKSLDEIDTQTTDINDAIYLLNEEKYALENVQENPEKEPRKPEEIQADIDAKTAELEALKTKYDAIQIEALPEMQPILDEVYAKIEAGESFDDLVVEYGKDPGMATNKDGYMVHKDSIMWDLVFRDAAIALEKVGDVSEPTLTGFGAHVIQYASDVADGMVPMTDEVAAAIRETLLNSYKDEAFAIKLDEWIKGYEIERHPELIVLPTPETVETDEDPVEEPAASPETTTESAAPADAATPATSEKPAG